MESSIKEKLDTLLTVTDTEPLFQEIWENMTQYSKAEIDAMISTIRQKFPDDIKIQADVLLSTCNWKLIHNEFDGCLSDNIKAEELYKNLRLFEGEAAAHISRGILYRSKGDIDRALSYFQTSVEYIQLDSLYKGFRFIGKYQIGEILSGINNYDEAIKNYNEVVQFGHLVLQSRAYNGMGNVFLKQKKWENALKMLEKALEIGEQLNNDVVQTRYISDLGNFYFEQGDLDKSLEAHNKSYQIRKSLNLKSALISDLISFYKIFQLKGEENLAFQNLQHALEIADYLKLKDKLQIIYLLFSEYYSRHDDNINALKSLRNHIQIKEELINSSADIRIQGIQAVGEVEYAKREAEIIREKNKALKEANDEITSVNKQLNETLDELTRVKISRKSMLFSIGTAIILIILTEVFLDPLIDKYSGNNYFSLAVKILIGLSLKPIESVYERILIKKSMHLRQKIG